MRAGTATAGTAATVAVAGHYALGLPWASAVTLGAVLGPTDAVAALAATRGLAVARRVVVVLDGESLVNDASALVLYRVAVAARCRPCRCRRRVAGRRFHLG